MFAVDHAATALLLKRRYPTVPIAPLLIAVQAMELAWVVLNFAGVERTTTERTVRSVADIHLTYMPWSHSVATALGAAVVAWLVIEFGARRPLLGRAVGLGIASHLVLDLVTHAQDIALAPGLAAPKLGLGLYDAAPLAGFALELVYGVACWRIYRGGVGLLAFVVVGNLANLSIFSAAIRGPEELLAGRPLLVVGFILAQIVVTLLLVGVLSRRAVTPPTHGSRRAVPGRLIVLDRQVDLRDVGPEHERDRPVEDHPHPAVPARHLEEVVRPPDPPRDETGQPQPEDLRDAPRMSERGHRA
jgi:hypothetical protein